MKGLGFAAYGAVVGAATLFAAPIAVETINSHAKPEMNSTALWSLWLLATLGPLNLSALVWMTDQKFALRWFPHLAFVPVAIVVWQQSMSLFLRVSGLWIHDGPAGDASALGTLYLLVTLLVHLSAFGMAATASVKSQANGS